MCLTFKMIPGFFAPLADSLVFQTQMLMLSRAAIPGEEARDAEGMARSTSIPFMVHGYSPRGSGTSRWKDKKPLEPMSYSHERTLGPRPD